MIILPGGAISHIYNLNLTVIADRCPILRLSFEDSVTGHGPKASLEAPSRDVVIYFLRFLYLGDYATYDHLDRKKPCSLLIHAQLCKMADIYSLPELRATAHVNFMQETEFSCSEPTPPIDLCPAIRYVYQYLTNYQPLVDTLLNYCVCCFTYHSLGTNREFRDIAYNLSEFHRDLCLTSYNRDFQDDGAAAIVCLPVYKPTPHSNADMKRAAADFLFEIWSDTEDSEIQTGVGATGKTREKKRRRTLTAEGGFALVYRPKITSEPYIQSGDESSSDEGFALVHRPRPEPNKDAQAEPSDGDISTTESGSEASSDSETDATQAAQLADSFMTVKGSSSPTHQVDIKTEATSDEHQSNISPSMDSEPEPEPEPVHAILEKPKEEPSGNEPSRTTFLFKREFENSESTSLEYCDRLYSRRSRYCVSQETGMDRLLSFRFPPDTESSSPGRTVKRNLRPLNHKDLVKECTDKPCLSNRASFPPTKPTQERASRSLIQESPAAEPSQEDSARKDSIADDDDFFALFNNDKGSSSVSSAHDSLDAEYELHDTTYSSESEWSIV